MKHLRPKAQRRALKQIITLASLYPDDKRKQVKAMMAREKLKELKTGK